MTISIRFAKQVYILFQSILFVLILGVGGCGGGGGGGGSNSATCSVTNYTTVNLGGSSGGNYTTAFGQTNGDYEQLMFNNVSLNLSPTQFCSTYLNCVNNTSYIVNTGTTCFSNQTSWPGGGSQVVAMVVGQHYVIQYNLYNGQTIYFRVYVASYSFGVATIDYIQGLAS